MNLIWCSMTDFWSQRKKTCPSSLIWPMHQVSSGIDAHEVSTMSTRYFMIKTPFIV